MRVLAGLGGSGLDEMLGEAVGQRSEGSARTSEGRNPTCAAGQRASYPQWLVLPGVSRGKAGSFLVISQRKRSILPKGEVLLLQLRSGSVLSQVPLC